MPMHSARWTTDRIDDSIARGLEFLDNAGTFGMNPDMGGESAVHHFFLERVLELHDHPGLRRQMAEARALNQDDWQWKVYLGLPGRPRPVFSERDKQSIKDAMRSSPKNYYAVWIAHALNPQWTTLPPAEEIRLFHDTGNLRHNYHLTHALMAYVWLKKSAPTIAEQRQVDRLIREVNTRLFRFQTWDPRTGDIDNERVAFWLHMEDGPPIRRRWIERILLSQNPDGGWPYHQSVTRTLRQTVGLKDPEARSNTHATFLALYALAQYQQVTPSP